MPEVLSFAQLQTLNAQPARILTTKLFAPRARTERVARPRLTRRLEEGLRRKMTLISAPAGFGKTTLLSEWRETSAQNAISIAWVSLDKGDNDFTRFVTYLIAALRTVESDLGAHAQSLLSEAPAPGEAVLVSLINDLAAFNGEIAIMLDDAHVIESQAIHEAIEFLLEHLPAHVHLIIASRTEPPLALARLRARNQLTEIHAADLRFTLDEATDFLQRVMKIDLPTAELTALINSTEGWAAGLQLAALSWQLSSDRARPLGGISGSDRYILDYLVEEVLQRQTEDVQTFLLQTSILDRLNGPLCDAVTEQANSQAMLELLDRLNLFVVPLDTQRQWYRYHHLFAELLRDRLQRWQAERVPLLHQRASAWFASQGLPREAIHHSLAAGDHERAMQLLEPIARDMLGRNEMLMLYDWLSALPSALLQTHISLALKFVWTQIFTSHLAEAAQTLEVLDATIGDGATPGVRGEAYALRATLAIRHGNWAQANASLDRAWELVPADSVMLRGVIALNRGVAAMLEGNYNTAMPMFTQAAELAQASHNPRTALTALNNLGALQAERGQLHAAADTYRHALAYAAQQFTADDTPQQPMSRMLHIGLGETLYEWNDLDAAEAEVRQGWCADEDQAWDEQAQLAGYLMQARLRQARGDLDGAIAVLDDGERFGQHCDSRWHLLEYVKTLRAQYQLKRGDSAFTQRRLEQANVTLDASSSMLQARTNVYLTWARLLIVQRDPKVFDLLDRLIKMLHAEQKRGIQIEAQVILTLAQHQFGEHAQALATLSHTLELAAPEGYMRVFLDEAGLMPLLTELRSQPDVADRLTLVKQLDRLLTTTTEFIQRRTASTPLEALNEREREILQGIAAGLSNQDIAQRLVVAVSTVKWHINNLYAKLNVHSRTLAVARARELGLL